jgi:photoactive yellow protein
MNTSHATDFADADIPTVLPGCSDTELDELEFGVIAIDAQGLVQRYNRQESTMAGLSPQRVLGSSLFTVVAPCMNNFMVAHRLDEALAAQSALDATIDYVLTLRMRPTPVRLRLLHQPGQALRYVLVQRKT